MVGEGFEPSLARCGGKASRLWRVRLWRNSRQISRLRRARPGRDSLLGLEPVSTGTGLKKLFEDEGRGEIGGRFPKNEIEWSLIFSAARTTGEMILEPFEQISGRAGVVESVGAREDVNARRGGNCSNGSGKLHDLSNGGGRIRTFACPLWREGVSTLASPPVA